MRCIESRLQSHTLVCRVVDLGSWGGICTSPPPPSPLTRAAGGWTAT